MDYVSDFLGMALATPLLILVLYFFGVVTETISRVRSGEIGVRDIALEAMRGYALALAVSSTFYISLIAAANLAGEPIQATLYSVSLVILSASSILTLGLVIAPLGVALAARELPRLLESMRAELNAKKTLQGQ